MNVFFVATCCHLVATSKMGWQQSVFNGVATVATFLRNEK